MTEQLRTRGRAAIEESKPQDKQRHNANSPEGKFPTEFQQGIVCVGPSCWLGSSLFLPPGSRKGKGEAKHPTHLWLVRSMFAVNGVLACGYPAWAVVYVV